MPAPTTTIRPCVVCFISTFPVVDRLILQQGDAASNQKKARPKPGSSAGNGLSRHISGGHLECQSVTDAQSLWIKGQVTTPNAD